MQYPSTAVRKSKVSHCGGRVPRHKANGARGAYPKDSPRRGQKSKVLCSLALTFDKWLVYFRRPVLEGYRYTDKACLRRL